MRKRVRRLDSVALNRRILEDVGAAIDRGERDIRLSYDARNGDQAIGVRLAGEMVRNKERYAGQRVNLHVTGTAGFGCFAFLAPGMTGDLEGFAGDDFGASIGKGVTLIARPPERMNSAGAESLIGSNALYGASGGVAYIRGGAGERFGVRLSGTRGVHEGSTGQYPYMFMTRGTMIQMGGQLGEEPFSGMTGGKVYVFAESDLETKMSHDSVVLRRELQSDEEQEIRCLLMEHASHTDSDLARTILDDWESFTRQWTVVEANKSAASSMSGVHNEARLENHFEVEAEAN